MRVAFSTRVGFARYTSVVAKIPDESSAMPAGGVAVDGGEHRQDEHAHSREEEESRVVTDIQELRHQRHKHRPH